MSAEQTADRPDTAARHDALVTLGTATIDGLAQQVHDLAVQAPLLGTRPRFEAGVQVAGQPQHQSDHQFGHGDSIHRSGALSLLWCYNDTSIVYHRGRYVDRHKRTFIERVCARCGNQFSVRKDAVSRGYGKYCGLPCYFAAKHVPVADRFWNLVDRSGGENACWLWIGRKGTNGYGHIGERKRHLLAHRVAWELTHGAIPGGMFVCHRCDTPACVNVAHLWLGTAAENSADMVAKGRSGFSMHPEAVARGEAVGMAKLTDESVREILRLGATETWTSGALGRRFDVSPATVQAVLSGRSWKHIPRTEGEG